MERAGATARPAIAGVILAGGLSRRMGGGDKGLLELDGHSLLGRIVARLAIQSAPSAIVAAGDPRRFAAFGLPVLDDALPGRPGPLAGILAGLDWAAGEGGEHLLSVPCDTPFLPDDLAVRLVDAAGPGGAVAASGGRVHPVIALWPVSAREAIRAALARPEAAVGPLVRRLGFATVEWAAEPVDPFLNLNRPEDVAAAKAALGLLPREAEW